MKYQQVLKQSKGAMSEASEWRSVLGEIHNALLTSMRVSAVCASSVTKRISLEKIGLPVLAGDGSMKIVQLIVLLATREMRDCV